MLKLLIMAMGIECGHGNPDIAYWNVSVIAKV
jgi:hypothetical protein